MEELRGDKKPHHHSERNSQLERKKLLSHYAESYIYLLRTAYNLRMHFSYTLSMPPWTTILVQWPPYAIISNRCVNMPLRCTFAKFIWKYIIYHWWFQPTPTDWGEEWLCRLSYAAWVNVITSILHLYAPVLLIHSSDDKGRFKNFYFILFTFTLMILALCPVFMTCFFKADWWLLLDRQERTSLNA